MSVARWTAALGLDATARASRLGFLEIDEGDRRLLGELAQVVAPHVDAIVAEWHEHLLARLETRDLLARGRVQEHLREVQARYFVQLLTGPYDEAYFEDRLRIGFVHERVALEPAWYMGSYRKFVALVRRRLLAEGNPPARVADWLAALEKVVYLDMELALDAYFHTRSREILDANRALNRLTGELEERNLDLARQIERAQEAARLKEELLAKVSHEVRTPLNGILGYADLLADGIDGPVSDEQGQSLRKIRRHGEHLLELFDQMLDAAKLAAAGVSRPTPFDPLPILARAVEAGRRAAEGKGLAFEAAIEPGLPPVQGDPEGFERGLAHLIENAVKFTARGRVRLGARREADRVRCEVEDTGPGIPPEHAQRVFEPFYQADSGDTRTARGLGMGLHLARQAVERMGGTLELTRTGPEGSRLTLTLSLARRP